MRKALIYWMLPLVAVFCMQTMAFADDVDSSGIPRDRWIHVDGEFVRQLQQRDSILIGDQLEYGFRLEGVEDGTVIGFPKLQESVFELIEDWTEKVVDHRSQGEGLPLLLDIEASIKVAAFEEGAYSLPPIVIGRVSPDGKVDTLFFDPIEVEIKTMPIDTATFEVHPMKGLIRTPFNWDEFVYTVKEYWTVFVDVLPWILAGKWVLILIIVGICIVLIKDRKGKVAENVVSEPAHIVALRKLDAFRSNAMWVPEKQKDFYTGVTDALREYISRRYGISAMEMTTAELFKAAENLEDFPSDLRDQLRDLFETADFVKFAKFIASDEDNASAVPKAVRFVTQTYQLELENPQTQTTEEQ